MKTHGLTKPKFTKIISVMNCGVRD